MGASAMAGVFQFFPSFKTAIDIFHLPIHRETKVRCTKIYAQLSRISSHCSILSLTEGILHLPIQACPSFLTLILIFMGHVATHWPGVASAPGFVPLGVVTPLSAAQPRSLPEDSVEDHCNES